MATFLYDCPITLRRVQGWQPDQESTAPAPDTYMSVTCLACGQLHLVDPVTGKTAGSERR